MKKPQKLTTSKYFHFLIFYRRCLWQIFFSFLFLMFARKRKVSEDPTHLKNFFQNCRVSNKNVVAEKSNLFYHFIRFWFLADCPIKSRFSHQMGLLNVGSLTFVYDFCLLRVPAYSFLRPITQIFILSQKLEEFL